MRYPQAASDKRYPALFTAAAAALGIPFYLGLIHLPVAQLLVYSGVASTAMATGQYVDTATGERGSAHTFMLELALWLALVTTFGSLAYQLALNF